MAFAADHEMVVDGNAQRLGRSYPVSASACSSQKRMSISRYTVAAMIRCSQACSRLPAR
jgi:hypothetical protein